MAYLLDTNVFLQAKNLHYGFDFCPGFWDWLKAENAKGNVFSTEKVKDELVDDDASQWADAQGKSFFLKPDAKVAAYYLVAHALAHSFVVVTHEVPANSVKKVKIPNACIGLGMKCMTPFEMLRAERARFVLAK